MLKVSAESKLPRIPEALKDVETVGAAGRHTLLKKGQLGTSSQS